MKTTSLTSVLMMIMMNNDISGSDDENISEAVDDMNVKQC